VDERVVCAITKSCDVSEDGGTPPNEASTDAGVCSAGATGKVPLGPALHSWSFDEVMAPYKDAIGTSDIPPASGFTTLPNVVAPACGRQLMLGGVVMPLGTATTAGAMGVVFDLFVPMPIATTFLHANINSDSWNIAIYTTAGGWGLAFNATKGGVMSAVSSAVRQPDMQWHRIEINGQAMTILLAIDGQMTTLTMVGQATVPSGSLLLALEGANGSSMAIDNLFVHRVP
jgi:hypothetical protein